MKEEEEVEGWGGVGVSQTLPWGKEDEFDTDWQDIQVQLLLRHLEMKNLESVGRPRQRMYTRKPSL